MKTKLKLSLLDDYLAVSKILIFCNNFAAGQNEMLNLKSDCVNLLLLINSVFENPQKDFSFAVFKQQVFQGVDEASAVPFQQNFLGQNVFDMFNVLKQDVVEKLKKFPTKI